MRYCSRLWGGLGGDAAGLHSSPADPQGLSTAVPKEHLRLTVGGASRGGSGVGSGGGESVCLPAAAAVARASESEPLRAFCSLIMFV